MPDNNTLREFSYSHPIKYKGVSYPSASANILTDGQQTPGNVFADANGNYFVLGDNDTAKSVMPVHSLDEVVVTPSKENLLSTQFNEYLTQNNDQTQIFDTPHREYNSHLRNKAIKGALSHNLWEQEHPNLSAWSQALSAVPFAVASTPLVGALGQSALATTAGQTARAGIASLMSNPIVDAANTGLGLGFAAKGAYDASQGEFTPETAMDLAGGAGLMFKSLTGLRKARRATSVAKAPNNIVPTNEEDINLFVDTPLYGKTEIPIGIKTDAAQRYTNFINSEDYQQRLQRAGLEDHWDYMKNLTDRRINNNGYFPGKVQKIVNNNPDVLGLSDVEPSSSSYGIILREDLPIEEVKATLMHELSHWATGNAGISDMANSVRFPFRNDPNVNYIGDIMRYNESIAPNITWDEILNNLPKSTPIDKVMEIQDTYNYLVRPTEKRARLMSVLQQAKSANMSTDAFVDKYTKNNMITPNAPINLQQLGEILTIDNIKKYLRNFLSVSTPIGITLKSKNSQHE